MGEERIELEKLNIVLFQSLAVLFSAYIVSLFKDAEYTSQTIAILYLLHFVAFYISNIAYRFYSRGYLDELFQVLKYNVFFAVGITFTSFMLDGVFSISRRGMIYFLSFQYVFRLYHGSLAQEIPEVCFTTTEKFAKDFLDHSDQSDGKGV